MITNGQLEIWDADRQILLGRDDPLVCLNVDIGRTVQDLDQRKAGFEALLELRRNQQVQPSQSVS